MYQISFHFLSRACTRAVSLWINKYKDVCYLTSEYNQNRIKIEIDTLRARVPNKQHFGIQKKIIVLFFFVGQLFPKRTTTCAPPCTGELRKKWSYMGLSLRPPKKKKAPPSRAQIPISLVSHTHNYLSTSLAYTSKHIHTDNFVIQNRKISCYYVFLINSLSRTHTHTHTYSHTHTHTHTQQHASPCALSLTNAYLSCLPHTHIFLPLTYTHLSKHIHMT